MSEQAPTSHTVAGTDGDPVAVPTPEDVSLLLDVVADHSVDHALTDIEQMVARLRADTVKVAAAREVLRATPAAVLREALQLRAARSQAAANTVAQVPAGSTRLGLVR